MDYSWITDQIALGGGIWNEDNMMEVARLGTTHVINMQIEFDDRPLAERWDIKVLWIPIDDDFLPKPPEIFELGTEFARGAVSDPHSRLYIHCAAGVHRAPMMTLAVLCSMGWELEQAQAHILERRYVVDWKDVYVDSVRNFLRNSGQQSDNMSEGLA
jgi:atypical dual specificity phosphatase